jgi:two-component system, NtrC family, response regulator AtoC
VTGDRPIGPFDSTRTLSDDDVAWLRAAEGDAELALQVYHRDGLREIPLREGSNLVIGRAPPADVPIRDPSLSRTHARVTCELGEVWLEDLGSTNGTQVDGRPIRRCEVRPGARIVLGATPAAIVPVGALASPGGVEGHDDFQGGLEAEVSRARAFRQPLALLMLRVGDDAPFGAVLARLRAALHGFEHLGLYSDDVIELLLPQCDEERAARRAGELSATAAGAVCGLAVYPRHGSTADELLGAARAALAGADASSPVRHAEARTARVVTDPATVEGDVVVASAAMRSVLDTAARIADASIPVLIQGETGTGKELVARAIHHRGPRRRGPLVCVNCGGIPGQLVESTLFGHERGAFTGADRRATGVFEAASGGTILLDEIGELPPAAQAALLRVLEAGCVSRVGSTSEIRVDVRVLAATHRDLVALADEGRFRRDLLYRLNAMTLEIPPLRERPEDIPPLARHFLAGSADAVAAGVEEIDGAAMALLQVHAWPGNVRELRNAIERAAVIARGESIALDDLPEPVRRLQRPGSPPAAEEAARSRSVGPLRERVRRYEAELIVEALNLNDGHRGRTAAALGVPLRTLSHRIQTLGIRRGRYQRPGE